MNNQQYLPPLMPSDHPDFVGGIVWSPLEIKAIKAYALSAIRAHEAAKTSVPHPRPLTQAEHEVMRAAVLASAIHPGKLAAAPTPEGKPEQVAQDREEAKDYQWLLSKLNKRQWCGGGYEYLLYVENADREDDDAKAIRAARTSGEGKA